MGYYSKHFFTNQYPHQYWLSRKDQNIYYQHLVDLAFTLNAIFPDVEIKNKYESLEKRFLERNEDYTKEDYWLYGMLIKGITKLHYPYRIKTGNQLEVAKEDLVLVIALLQPSLWPHTMISWRTKNIYQELMASFYPKDFSAHEAMRKLRIPRSTLQRHIRILQKAEYLERVGGNRNCGYWYNVGKRKM